MFVCVDFDSTISEHEYPDVGTEVPGAFRWMKVWQEAGARLILWTMRCDGGKDGPALTLAIEFCRKGGIEFFAVNENPTQYAWTSSRKAYAHIYVDDAAAGCPLRPSRRAGGRPVVDWDIVGPLVHGMILARNERMAKEMPVTRM